MSLPLRPCRPWRGLQCLEDEAGERSQSRKALHELLYGEQVQLFSYVDQAPSGSAASPTSQGSEPKEPEEAEKGPVTSSEQSDFLQIFLDVKHRNLYAAWAAANEQNVDYTTPAGAKAGSAALCQLGPSLEQFLPLCLPPC